MGNNYVICHIVITYESFQHFFNYLKVFWASLITNATRLQLEIIIEDSSLLGIRQRYLYNAFNFSKISLILKLKPSLTLDFSHPSVMDLNMSVKNSYVETLNPSVMGSEVECWELISRFGWGREGRVFWMGSVSLISKGRLECSLSHVLPTASREGGTMRRWSSESQEVVPHQKRSCWHLYLMLCSSHSYGK